MIACAIRIVRVAGQLILKISNLNKGEKYEPA